MKKNDLIELTIEDISTEGLGIGHAEGMAVFVKDTVIGDRLLARITAVRKNLAYARPEELLSPGACRVPAPCPQARRCGGCQIQEMDYAAQLAFKEKKVRGSLERIGGFKEIPMEPVMGMEEPFRYRNKAQFPVGTDREGNLTAGFYAGRTHSIIDHHDCLLGAEENREILETVLDHMRRYGIPAYNEETGKGLVRHVMTRKGFGTGQIMVCIVMNGTAMEAEEELADRLMEIPGVCSVIADVNRERTNVIMGKELRVIRGRDVIEDTIGDLRYRISPLSFYQVNPAQTEKLYGTVLEFADLQGTETVWDLYCGTGTISLFLARRAKSVIGVEIIPEAVRDAQKNAELNGIGNARFLTGRAEDAAPEIYRSGKENADVVVVDPPRKGCAASLLETILLMRPGKIVYVSCDPATLARDLKVLCAGGYELRRVRSCDMFPHTVHVETVCLLSKLHEAKHHIEVKVDMDELDLTSAEAKATYKEIQDWVQEKYGFHVTNLNIAQVKQKHGIIERENYNKPKSEDIKQPGCPEEKVEAIEDALRYFQMI